MSTITSTPPFYGKKCDMYSDYLTSLLGCIPITKNYMLQTCLLFFLINFSGVVITRFGTLHISNVRKTKNGKYICDVGVHTFKHTLRCVLKIRKNGEVCVSYSKRSMPGVTFYTRIYVPTKHWLHVNFSNLDCKKHKVVYRIPSLKTTIRFLFVGKQYMFCTDELGNSYKVVTEKNPTTLIIYLFAIDGDKKVPLYKEYVSEKSVNECIYKVGDLIDLEERCLVIKVRDLPEAIR